MSKSKAKKLRDQARLQKHKMAGPPALPIMFSGNRVVVAKILATPEAQDLAALGTDHG